MDIKSCENIVDTLLDKMTLEQKVGQCFTYLWSGHLITPSVIQAIEKLHCGNLRIQPAFLSGKRHKYYKFDVAAGQYDYPKGYPIDENLLSAGCMGTITPKEYAERLNGLQQIAMNRPAGIPLSFSIDQEGDLSRNYPFAGFNLMSSAMGQAAAGDPPYVYELNKALGRQLREIGITCIHSPVVDVNINPDNPEIGIRAYGDDPKAVAEYALAAMNGMQDAGLIATAKHFPGRGDSASDAHFGTPKLDVSLERLKKVELHPYRALIRNGLDSIMIAHNIYDALDPDVIATVSRRIITDLLRKELGFEGVITTDAIAMGALMNQYSLPEACARALQAGADLVLNKTETAYRDQGFLHTLRFVKEGKIPEEELNAKVRRNLLLKARKGLFENNAQVDVSKSGRSIEDPHTINLINDAAGRACMVLRDRENLLPLNPGQRVLIVEQRLQDVYLGMNASLHRLAFTEAMLSHTQNAIPLDTQFEASPEDESMLLPLLDQVDVVVITNNFLRGEENNTALVQKILERTSKLVLVGNSPYPHSMTKGASTCLCTFGAIPSAYKAAAKIIFGDGKSEGRWPLSHYKID